METSTTSLPVSQASVQASTQEDSHETLTQKQSITYADFDRLDFRIGTIEHAEAPEWSKKLLKFTVDFGPLGKRIIFSGIKSWYSPEDFLNKQFVFLVNLQPKKMGGEESQGMMVMADTMNGNPEDLEKPTLIPLTTQVPNGTVVR